MVDAPGPVVIRRVVLRNYKSIAACDVPLSPLTFLVVANGSGKSNFLEGVRFVADSLRTSLDHALRDRGTIQEVRRRSGGHPNHVAVRLDFVLKTGAAGHFSFRVGAKPNGGYEVQEEECRVLPTEVDGVEVFYAVKAGRITTTTQFSLPACSTARTTAPLSSAHGCWHRYGSTRTTSVCWWRSRIAGTKPGSWPRWNPFAALKGWT